MIIYHTYNNENKIIAFSDNHGSHRMLLVPENVDTVICACNAVDDNLTGDEYEDTLLTSLIVYQAFSSK